MHSVLLVDRSESRGRGRCKSIGTNDSVYHRGISPGKQSRLMPEGNSQASPFPPLGMLLAFALSLYFLYPGEDRG